VGTVRDIIRLTEQIESLRNQIRFLELERERLIEAASAEANTPSLPFSNNHDAEVAAPLGDVSVSELLQAVSNAEEIDATGLTELLPLSYDGARLRLARYAKRGLLMRVSRGRYRIAQRPLTNGAIHFEHEEDKSEPPNGASR
jgi:hypothetical protein